MSISAEDGTSQRCTVNVRCESGSFYPSVSGSPGGIMIFHANEFSAQVWDFDDLHNCSGTLQVGAC